MLATARRPPARFLFSLLSVAGVTAAIYALRPAAPVLSLGVLYVIAVVTVAVFRGLAYAIPVCVASLLTFNFLFLPPVHTFALRDSANWVALAAYLVTAVVVSELATRSRRLARGGTRPRACGGATRSRRRSSARRPRPALAADRDPRRKRGARPGSAERLRRGARRARRSDPPRGAPPRPARREPARSLAPRGGRRRAAPRAVDGRRPRRAGARGDRRRRRARRGLAGGRLAADPRRPRADRARAREPARERARVLVAADPVEVDSRASPTAEVVLRVRDHGPGIAAADGERIFEPFERGTGEPARHRPRAGDRAGLRRGERRPSPWASRRRPRRRPSCSSCRSPRAHGPA